MKLQKKVFWVIVVTLVGLSLLMSFTSNYRTVKAFQSVEERFFQRDMLQVQSNVDESLRKLRQYASDWGAWDAMYSFVKTKDIPSFSALLSGMSLRALNVDMLVVVDAAHNPVITYTVSELGEELAFSDAMLEDLKQTLPYFTERKETEEFEEKDAMDGVIVLGDRSFLVASNAILMTNWSGPSRGMIFVGFDMKDNLGALSELLDMELSFLPVEAGRYPSQFSGKVAVESKSDGTASVWQLRGDLLGTQKNYAIRMTTNRDIYNEGTKAIRNSYFWIVLNGVVLTFIVIKLLDTLVLKRLRMMREIADGITESVEISLRVPVVSNDEIAALGASFNILFSTLENLLMEIPDSMFITDVSGNILLANTAALHILGVDDGSNSLKGIPISQIVRKSADPQPEEVARVSDFQSVYEAGIAFEDTAALVPVEIHQQPVTYGNRKVVLFLARDLRDRKKLERRLERRAYYDDLTGLPNRTSLIEKLIGVLRSPDPAESRLAFAVVNMDHFKLINAQLGNTNGDRILLIVAQRIKELVTDDVLVYRTGGDEFSLVLPGFAGPEKKEDLSALFARIQTSISVPCAVGDGSVYPSASVGVISDISDLSLLKNPTVIIEKAMQALKSAKKSGLGVTVFYEDERGKEQSVQPINILTMRAELYSALEKNEFVANFQPIYEIEGQKLCGFETLVRWRHPKKGLLFPGAFIPHAENMGLVGDIDRCMILQAFEAIGRAPEDLYFSANGSANFLHSPYVADVIQGFLDKTGADPTRFVLEVTESVLIENLSIVSETLDKLRSKGIRIYLDDFGTGYSSLQYIHSLPLDCIKLDMGFTRRVLESDKDARMLRSIVDMANALNLDTIAEGVENESQLLWLQEAGCKKAQGYYFSKPIPWEDAEKLIVGGRSA